MDSVNGIAQEQLKNFIERIERLEEEKKGLAEDIKEVYAQAKAVGFDTKIMRKVISVRKMDRQEREEQETLLDVYLHAIEGGDLPTAGDPTAPAAAPVTDAAE